MVLEVGEYEYSCMLHRFSQWVSHLEEGIRGCVANDIRQSSMPTTLRRRGPDTNGKAVYAMTKDRMVNQNDENIEPMIFDTLKKP